MSSLMVRILLQAVLHFLLVIDEVKSLVTVPSCLASETLGWTACTVSCCSAFQKTYGDNLLCGKIGELL